MKTQELLSRLDKVKQTGKGRWIACCPAHQDRTPSMVVTEGDDRLLLHCFAGCSVYDILAAVGMDATDLFPDMPWHHDNAEPKSKRFLPQDVLQCLSGEVMFLIMCAKDMAEGDSLTEGDRKRLKIAFNRLTNAARAAGI